MSNKYADCSLLNPHWPLEAESPGTAMAEGTLHPVLLQRHRIPNLLRCWVHTLSLNVNLKVQKYLYV